MSNDLRDLFKRELDQIPLQPAETWVPERRRPILLPRLAWRAPLALLAALVVLVVAVVGGRQLATFRDHNAATPGIVAGKALYLSPSFNGSGWIQIDPTNLKDLSSKPLLDIAPSTTNSSEAEVSTDGSTIIVNEFNGGAVTQRVYDARTGQLRGYFVPEVAMVVDDLSADGSLAMGRVGDNRSPVDGEKVIVSVADGHVVRHVPATSLPGVVQARPTAADLSAIYYVLTPTAVSLISTSPQEWPYSLVVQSTLTGALSGPIPLPGILARTFDAGPVSNLTALTVRPAIAMSADGRRLAALSNDGGTLDVVDLRTLAVSSVTVHKRTSLIDLLSPLVAEAKTLNDQEQQAMAFTPDGSAVISWVTETHYDDVNGPTRTTRGIQRVDLATGLVTAENSSSDGIYGFVMSPDGQNVYLVVRTQEPPNPLYVLRRLDATSLEVKAERTLPDYAELQLLAAPTAAAAAVTPTPPTRTQAPVGCPRARLEYLIEGFFTMYNAHHSADLSNLFKTQQSAAAGGFSDYSDNPGVPVHITNVGKLLAYWEQRFAAGDRFDTHNVTYPPEGSTPTTANPIATFTRSFAGGTQQGNIQFDCSDGLLVAVRLSSDYPGWESRDAFGVQFSVPAAWNGPADIDTQKGPGAPKNWLVFTDAGGSTQVSVWLVDDTAEHFAATRLQGSDRRTLTISDAGQSRDVIEVHATAIWSGPTGAGSYDNRHLVVQVTPTLAADVFVSAPRINGPSSLTPEQVQLQDRISVRLAAGTDLAAAQTHVVDGYTFTAQLLFDHAYGASAADAAHFSGLEGVGLACTWSRTGNDVGKAEFLFGPAAAPTSLAGYTNLTHGTSGNRIGGFPDAASSDTSETHAVCAVRDAILDHGIEVVVQFTRQAGTTVVSQVAFNPWRR
jgi:hypothetical protein